MKVVIASAVRTPIAAFQSSFSSLKASELGAAGLNAGVFTGMRFNISSIGSEVRNLEIKMGQTSTSCSVSNLD